MKTEAASAPLPRQASAPRAKPAFFERALCARLEQLAHGRLVLEWRGARATFGTAVAGQLEAEVHVLDERFFAATALRGSVGAGEAYARGWWTSPAPATVVRLFVRNRAALTGLEGGLARLARPVLAVAHALRRNTRSGSRANIAAHYDLSNGFFALFLDETMTYSCGLFERPESTLKEASLAKIDRLCKRLELSSRDHLLEIGTGWGAFALHAAREYGCRVTTTTISKEQHALAAERIAAAGLEERVTLLQRDYRDLEGTYDKLVSVEMIEAVGHQYFGTFFETCARLLAPEGRMALQAITIADPLYDEARRSVDFIQACIFPGSCIPSVSALVSAAARSSDLVLDELSELGPHYVRTLAAWRANLRANWARARAQGVSEEQLRLFEFYFAYCEGGYAEGQLGNVQMRFARPGARRVGP
ncbi:MAG: cyclopropane-fatty-acyl-phospholipid synthase family protein [Planctomycetota bacterium]